jgi:hypothetical protein
MLNNNDLYGLLDPIANKFIVVSKNFTAIKNLQFIIMQKVFYPVANISKTILFQKRYHPTLDVPYPEITNGNCYMYGVNPMAIQSLEKTLPFHTHSNNISNIQVSTTSMDLNKNIVLLLNAILEILEIVENQLTALKEFKKATLKDRHEGIFEFKKFLKKTLDTKEQLKSLDEIFDQEIKLFNTDIPETENYQKFITRTLIQLFNDIDINKDGSTYIFLQQLLEQLKIIPTNIHIIFTHLLECKEFSEIEFFQKNPESWKTFISQHTMPAQLLSYVSDKHKSFNSY